MSAHIAAPGERDEWPPDERTMQEWAASKMEEAIKMDYEAALREKDAEIERLKRHAQEGAEIVQDQWDAREEEFRSLEAQVERLKVENELNGTTGYVDLLKADLRKLQEELRAEKLCHEASAADLYDADTQIKDLRAQVERLKAENARLVEQARLDGEALQKIATVSTWSQSYDEGGMWDAIEVATERLSTREPKA